MPAVVALEGLVGTPAQAGIEVPRRGIRFQAVSFRYPGASVDTFSKLDLFIPAGQSPAVLGLNGAGKTTELLLVVVDRAAARGPARERRGRPGAGVVRQA